MTANVITYRGRSAAREVGKVMRFGAETLGRLSSWADYGGTGVNIGKHPMAHRREEMNAIGVTCASDLLYVCSGETVRIAGCVIVRQRPGTAKGIVLLSVEDETGIANVVVLSEMFDADRARVIASPWLLIEGPLQNVDNVIHVRAKQIDPLPYSAIKTASHDFH